MKKFLGTMAFALLNIIALGQSQKTLCKGTLSDAETNQPLANATIVLKNNQIAIADENGNFLFAKIAKGVYRAMSLS